MNYPEFTYSKWRHGGWYVDQVRYPSGACGCVTRNYEDGKWRIACDDRPFDERPTFATREEAARAEYDLAKRETISARLEYLRGELRAGRISYSEQADLEGLAEHIEPGDVELLEAAGVPEFAD